MNITLFITMLTIGSGICSLITEAVKKAFYNVGKDASPNIIALVDAVVVGGFGTAIVYMLMGIQWTVNNIICLVLMIVAVWIGAMVGFDKVKQTIEQLIKKNEASEKEE